MNIQKYRINKAKENARVLLYNEKAFRKECIKEYKRLYNQISSWMNDGYSEYSFKMKCTRAETVAILALLCRFDWLVGHRRAQYIGNIHNIKVCSVYQFKWK